MDGANSSLVGTFSSNGSYPLRLAYNPVQDEFGIIVYDSKKVINVDAETGTINSTDNYSQYGNPVMIMYDVEGKPLVLTNGNDDAPGYLVRDGEAVALPASPTYFDYCPSTHTAVVTMPADYVSVIEYELNTDPPVADFTANVTTIQIGGEVEFTDLSQNSPTSWDWNFEGGVPATSTEQNPTVTYENMGLFDVSLTAGNANGSGTKTEENYIQVDTLTFINENGNPIELSVYPNPVSGKLYIKLNQKPQKELSVTIFNLEGRMLFTQKLSNLENVIDMQNLNAGVYILKVTDGDRLRVMKINKR